MYYSMKKKENNPMDCLEYFNKVKEFDITMTITSTSRKIDIKNKQLIRLALNNIIKNGSQKIHTISRQEK